MNFYTSNSKKYLLVFFVVFLTSIIAFAIASEWLLRTHVQPNDNLGKAIELLNNKNANGIAVGDSHMSYGFKGNSNFINAAFKGSSFKDILYKATSYSKKFNPEFIIIQADSHLFSNIRLTQPLSSYLDTNKNNVLLLQNNYFSQFLLAYWKQFLTNKPFKNKVTYHTDTGWVQSNKQWSEVNALERMLAVNQRKTSLLMSKNKALVLEGQKKYEETIKKLLDSGAKICLLGTPLSKEYLSSGEVQKNINQASIFFTEMANKYQNVQYVNATSLYSNEEDEVLFVDTDHLNALGAEKFTQYVMENCF